MRHPRMVEKKKLNASTHRIAPVHIRAFQLGARSRAVHTYHKLHIIFAMQATYTYVQKRKKTPHFENMQHKVYLD